MNELPRIEEEPDDRLRRLGVEAIEQELRGQGTEAVGITLVINRRMIQTTTDSTTIAKIMALLTGLGG